jgi:mercuric reductase
MMLRPLSPSLEHRETRAMSDCCAPPPKVSKRDGGWATLPSFLLRPGVMFPDWSAVTSPVVKDALLAMVKSDHVLRRWSGYTPAIDRVRTAVLRLYAEDGRAPTLAGLAHRAGLAEAAVRPLLDYLRRRDLVIIDGERLVGAYPFSDRDTGHQIRLGSRTVNAMCAVDALGVGAMVDRDVEVASRCHHCGAPIRVATRDRGRVVADVAPRTAVVWLRVHYEGGCAASSLCVTTAFFCTDDHLMAWRRKRPADEPGFRLSIEEGLEVGRAIFAPSLAGLHPAQVASGDIESHGSTRLSAQPLSTTGPIAGRRAETGRGNGCAYDLIVIGAGSAGFSAAITAAEQGAEVALIGRGTIGGTCVNIGCVPSKTLIRAAETLHNARAAARFAGITAEVRVADWQATVRQKDALVTELRQAKYIDLLPAYSGITYREGPARLVEGGVAVNGTRLLASKIIVATGARPAIPAIPGIQTVPYLTSTTALELQQLPTSLLVIGGGYIGAELAQMFARAGVRVTLVCWSRLLNQAEPEIGGALADYFAEEGITVVSGITYRAIRRTEHGVALTITHGSRDTAIEAERVLLAAGRTPNIEELGLAEHRVAVADNGGIVVDDRMRTTRPATYAAGDVTGRDQFVYMAP